MVQYRKGRPSPWMLQMRNEKGEIKTYSFIKKSDAVDFENKERRRKQLMKRGMGAPSEDLLVFDFSVSWMKSRVKSLAAGTIESDGQRLKKYVLPSIGTQPIASVSSNDIRSLLDLAQEEEELSNATRNRIRAVLHTMFHDAFMQERIIANPVARVELLKESPAKKKPLDETERDALIAMAYERDKTQGLATVILMYEGLRNSEAAGLQVGDIDLANDEIHVRRIWEQCTNTIRALPKGGRELVIPLFPRAKVAILDHLASTPFKRPNDFLICDEAGHPRGGYSIRTRMSNDADAVNFEKDEKKPKKPMRHISPHVLRATFATLAEEAGYSKEDVQRLLGHSTVLVTERYVSRSASQLKEKGRQIGFGSVPGLVSFKKEGLK